MKRLSILASVLLMLFSVSGTGQAQDALTEPKAQENFCVSCGEPDATYQCQISTESPEATLSNPSAKRLFCIVNIAKDKGHQSCSIEKAVEESCDGEKVSYTYKPENKTTDTTIAVPQGQINQSASAEQKVAENTSQGVASETGNSRILPPGNSRILPPGSQKKNQDASSGVQQLPDEQKPVSLKPEDQKPQGLEPLDQKNANHKRDETLKEKPEAEKKKSGTVIGRAIENTGEGLNDAGKAIGKTAKKAGNAVGNAAKSTFDCVSSLFKEC